MDIYLGKKLMVVTMPGISHSSDYIHKLANAHSTYYGTVSDLPQGNLCYYRHATDWRTYWWCSSACFSLSWRWWFLELLVQLWPVPSRSYFIIVCPWCCLTVTSSSGCVIFVLSISRKKKELLSFFLLITAAAHDEKEDVIPVRSTNNFEQLKLKWMIM